MLPEISLTQVSSCMEILRTEEAIFFIKDMFGKRLTRSLNLVNV